MFKRKRNIIAFVAIAIVAALLVLARSYFLKKFHDSVLDEIQALNESDIKIHYDTIYINWLLKKMLMIQPVSTPNLSLAKKPRSRALALSHCCSKVS
jgi:hypothetical protein